MPRPTAAEDPEQHRPQVVEAQRERLLSERADKSLEGKNGGSKNNMKSNSEEGKNKKRSEEIGKGNSDGGCSAEEARGSSEEKKRGGRKALSRVSADLLNVPNFTQP